MHGYTETIRQWAVDNRRAGMLADADGTGEVGLAAAEVGRRLAVRFTLKLDGDRVADIRYQVFGCGFTMAACAAAADLSLGQTLDEVRLIDERSLDRALDGLPPERAYCAELAVKALQAAVNSARNGRRPVQANFTGLEHGPRLSAEDAVYAALVSSPKPEQVPDEDRHLFACLLAVAAREPCDTAAALGLEDEDLAFLLKTYFPQADPSVIPSRAASGEEPPPERNSEVLAILLRHIPTNLDRQSLPVTVRFAYILATRATLPGHLWVAMGLFERSELSAAIRRHLPSLAAMNNRNMRWKKFLYRQVCDRNGGVMCKAPNCGVCSDYALCFAGE
jgi:nitrogen fixation protein NifQ